MGAVAAVTLLLNAVAALTEGRTDLLRNTEVFPLDSHPIKCDRMPSFLELLELFLVALSAFIRKDHGFLIGCGLMVNVAGHAVDAILCMLRFHP